MPTWRGHRRGGPALLEVCEPRRLLSFTVAVNFQPAESPKPAGYAADSGLTFGDRGNGLSYGWNDDNSANMRDRAAPGIADPRYDTLAMMQEGGDKRWEIALPDDIYRVHVISGDPDYPTANVRIDAEGQRIIDGGTDSLHPWIEGWAQVAVSDGRLTIGPGEGAFNTKIDFVEITSELNSPIVPAAFPEISRTVTIGTNLDGLSYFDTIAPFNDLTAEFNKWGTTSEPWITTGVSIPKTIDYYPLADASALTFATGYPSGDYQVSYQGEGTVSFSRYHQNSSGDNEKLDDLAFTPTQRPDGSWKGAVHLEMPPVIEGWYFVLSITGINAANPVHDLHIISPDANPAISPTFRPVFLQKLAAFNGPLRMMDWMQTNASSLTSFNSRTKPSRFGWANAPNGMPYEVMIELANELHKDLWVNIPHKAYDSYITSLADMLRDQLDPTLKVYVEYSNEVWNANSVQGRYVYTGLAPADGITAAQEMGKQTVRVSEIFKTEFGPSAAARQVRPILGGFIAGSYWAQDAMDYIQANYPGKPGDYISGIAVAPYVGVESDMPDINNADLTLDTLFGWMNNWIDTTIDGWLKANKRVADQYEVKLEAYEGGQHLQALAFGDNEAIKRAAQDDPRMGDVYRHLIGKWAANGGDIFGNFALATKYSPVGYWGLLQNINEPDSVKYSAVTGMIGRTLHFFAADEAMAADQAAAPVKQPPRTAPAKRTGYRPGVIARAAVAPPPMAELSPVTQATLFGQKRLARVFD